MSGVMQPGFYALTFVSSFEDSFAKDATIELTISAVPEPRSIPPIAAVALGPDCHDTENFGLLVEEQCRAGTIRRHQSMPGRCIGASVDAAATA